ncbi:hypothetical protein A6M21_13420 [Desulfotomaculum copahuensis]|uniref:Uncharacterized protein n=1 Tax=Desulfotomaculum copahuensis TaxID=1838280 RepID=A0A1B7LCH5_9FIRM|nr:hypothetical protein A6M21_13420 [Desulfotomaculum copahuensis]
MGDISQYYRCSQYLTMLYTIMEIISPSRQNYKHSRFYTRTGKVKAVAPDGPVAAGIRALAHKPGNDGRQCIYT